MTRRAPFAVLMAVALTTASCGITYVSPSVRNQSEDVPVRVMTISSQSVLMANRAPYTPQRLPQAFYETASGAGQMRQPAALPDAPRVPDARYREPVLRPPPPLEPAPYRIGVGDVVLLATKSAGSTVEQLSGLLAAQTQRQGFTVRDDGTISIPDVGAPRIGGLTLEEAENELFEMLLANGMNPAFSLEVQDFNAHKVVVGGAVGSPSVVPITLQPLTLRLAIAAAGGLAVPDTRFATIRIFRNGSLYEIPVAEFDDDADLQDTILRSGDAVFVDLTYDYDRALEYFRQQIDVIALERQSRQQAFQELQAEIAFRQAALNERRSNFQTRLDLGAEARDYVYLSGEIANQTRLPLPFGQKASLADILFEAGGFDVTTGNPSHIYVLRPSPEPEEFGAVTAWHLDARNPAAFTLAARFEMRPDDVVFIEEQPITRWNRALRQFFPVLINTARSALGD
ncbi:polysaccharide biosynthesis/export family protein [Rhodosalinus halophilus]|nr:polysaccharide biosynthesis/export family protein [Rhodosalinus halophilus]